MANTCESVQGPSLRTSQMADRLGPNGYAGRRRRLTSPTRGQDASRSTCRCLRSRTPEAETSKSRILAYHGESPIFPPRSILYLSDYRTGQGRSGSRAPGGKPIVSEAQGGAGVGPRSKRMPSCNGPDTGSDICRGRPARRESELTSFGGASLRKSTKNRLKQGKQWNVEASVDHMCTLSFDFDRSLAAACESRKVRWTRLFSVRVGRMSPAFEVLEPYAGKLACTVLRGLGGRKRPPGYLTAAETQKT